MSQMTACASAGRLQSALLVTHVLFSPMLWIWYDLAPVQVRTMSPMPARPLSVSGCAPSATARRTISLCPRVISAARPLPPKSRPSTMPQPMASTFFSAPASSTPGRA